MLTMVIIGAAVFFLVVKPVNVMIDRFNLSTSSHSPATQDVPRMFHRHPAESNLLPEPHQRAVPHWA